MGVEGETFLLTRYCFSLISLGTYALRLCLVCVVDVRVCPRSSVGILEEALDLTVDLCTALFLHAVESLHSNNPQNDHTSKPQLRSFLTPGSFQYATLRKRREETTGHRQSAKRRKQEEADRLEAAFSFFLITLGIN